MTDRQFLLWIHERLEFVHGDNPLTDYMHHLRAIVLATPVNQASVDRGSGNNSTELRKLMGESVDH